MRVMGKEYNFARGLQICKDFHCSWGGDVFMVGSVGSMTRKKEI